ncbi:MAG: hemerythrin [Bacteroidetes bacterium QH_2_63_10]|nr:MAG: hemerythrin [Bacteroidetes bacterium QH_2_63_10]
MSTPAPNALDVRPLPAGRKLPTALAIFEDLEAGDSFVLVDDSDPTALRTGIEAERPGGVRWVALEEGPPVWSVRVRRRLPE